MSNPRYRRIDAHLHLWDRAASDYAWITPALGGLYADFESETAAEHLLAAGIDGAILVQADDNVADTRFMLDVAAANSWVIGVVGWVPLEDPHRAESLLADYSGVCGIRQLVHIDPRDGLLDLPVVQDTLRLISQAGLALDVPNAWPRNLSSAQRIATSIPELTVVIDHLGTPPADFATLDAWERAIRNVAACTNTVAKVSGLQHLAADALRRVWDVALDAFGPARLAYGSDWPMTVATGDYQGTWQRVNALIGELAEDEQADILSGTAIRAYRLETI